MSVILACYTSLGRRWFKAATDIPRPWWLRSELDDDSFAYDLLEKGTQRASVGKQPAEVWFENSDAENYEVQEHCTHGKSGEVLVLVYLAGNMLNAGFDPDVGNRRYNEFGSYVTGRSRRT